MLKSPDSTQWYLWHGHVFRALEEIESIEMDLETVVLESSDEIARNMKQALHLLGLPFGTHHRGLGDARHIARIAQALLSVLRR